jgi:Putative transmembrane protein (PGPGW)
MSSTFLWFRGTLILPLLISSLQYRLHKRQNKINPHDEPSATVENICATWQEHGISPKIFMDSLIASLQSSYASLTAVISEETLIAIGIISTIMFVGTLVAIPIILSRLPINYFQHDLEHVWMEGYPPMVRNMGLIAKNAIGLIFLMSGLAMLLLPGQGLLTMIIGLSLLDFPGKRKLEHKLLTRPMIFQAMNAIRAKCSKPPFDPPTTPSPSSAD